MAQSSDPGTQNRRTSSSGDRAGGSRQTPVTPAPQPSPAPLRQDLTLDARAAQRPLDPSTAATRTTVPEAAARTSTERLSLLAAQLPSVARDAYIFGPEVAKGGIGRVLRARDRRLDRPVAIKELLVWNERQEHRFVQEALLTARLQHPAIVPIYEAGRWPDGEPFYAMKLVSGRSLADLIDERASLAERLSLLPHVLTAAQATAYAHSKRILHRDLKPANILVGEFGETVVIDWGLAKDLAEEEAPAAEPEVAPVEGLTLQGAIVGTPSYMPPEQAAGRAVDERADVYAIGAILYHLLAAVPPYHDVPWEKLLATIAGQPPRRVEELEPSISDELAAIVHKAMARDPAQRYRTARELADDLERFQTGRIVAAHTYSSGQLLRRYWRRNRPALSVAAVAFALVTLVVIGAFVKTERDRRFAVLKEREAVLASRSAETARRAAETAGRQATARADEMTLLQAQWSLQRDPNQALAWLKTLSPELTDAAEVRRIAADAWTRGISRAFRGHTEFINDAGVTADGRRFATASDDKTARVWDIATGRSQVLAGHADEVWNAVFLPGGDRLATTSKDGTVRVWDIEKAAEIARVELPAAARMLIVRADGAFVGTPRFQGAPWIWRPGAKRVELLSTPGDEPLWSWFTPDGRRLIEERKDGTVDVLDVDSGARRTLPRPASGTGIWVTSDDSLVAVRVEKGAAEVWDLTAMTRLGFPVAVARAKLELSPRGDLLAVPDGDAIQLYDTKKGAPVRRLTGHAGAVRSMAFSPDGQLFATGAYDRTVRTWDLATGESEVHAGLKGTPIDLEILADGRSVLAVSSIGEARLFEPSRAGKILADHGAQVTGLALAGDGRTASIDEGGHLHIGDLEGRRIAAHAAAGAPGLRLIAAPDRTSFAGAPLAWSNGGAGRTPSDRAPPGRVLFGTFDAVPPAQIEVGAAILDIAWLLDGSAVVVALADGAVRRIERGGTSVELDRFEAAATSVAVSADGAWAAAGSEDGAVRVTEIATGRRRALGRHAGVVTALAFSPDGRWLASGTGEHTARLWSLDDGTFRSFDESGYGVEQLAFSPDGATLYVLSQGDTHVRRLIVESGDHLGPFDGHRGPILRFVLSGDGRRMLALGADGAARLLDTADGRGRTLPAHKRSVAAAGFTAGDRILVAGGHEGTVRAWPDDLPETMPELRAWIDAATPDHIEAR
jgi:eukaryotic-like serine/threonine-protein kinase